MKSFIKSFSHALMGLRFALSGTNFKVQMGIAVAVVICGLIFNIQKIEWLFLTLLIGLVLSAEVFNSAIENTVNFISPEFHPLAGKIKDLAAGAVLIVSVTAAIIGLIIFAPHLFSLWNRL